MGKELPKGWVETDLLSLANVSTGKRDANFASENGKYHFFTCAYEPLKADSYSFEGKVLILPGNGANVGEVFYYEGKFEAYQRTYIVNDIVLNSKFLYYYFKAYWRTLGVSEQFGSATNYIKIGNFKNFQIEFPPRAEQDRIVAKVDALMAQHAAIQQAMERIPQLLKDLRQQVLTQAVTGKLTEEWRVGKELEEWETELAMDCCEKVQSGGTPKGSNFALTGIPFFKVYNIVNDQISFEYKPQFVSEEIQNSQCKKSICYAGDVLMNIVGPPLNKVAIIPESFPESNINQAITLFRPKEYLSNKFLYYFLCEGSPVNSLINETRGVVGQVNISLTQCRNFEIPIPSEKEQQEIVRRVESLFEKATAIQQRYEQLKLQIDSLPQAILHKAFKGELVEQQDSDGSASELLREIEEMKKESKSKKR
ncbi:type I restriction-modification system specificity subunit S [Nonlabens ulvanivorans]|uniref:Type I restriction-modification system specificity subunit S n=1 Tax=Nonlabens ulvanivorans TaxID=906888 RepID=A0A090QG47_NONUL|nr:restriction endonuclease subunit S [Nonlabens ulvanivorans]GAL00774.1 type I restriction-modification system specificity subunit S [Nonlabens ulvanivorans]